MASQRTTLGIREKVELRRGLLQRPDELVSSFYDRCEKTEHLVADDLVDAAFQREVLIHFILGLRPELQLAVINSDAENRDEFYKAALLEANEVKSEKDNNIVIEEDALEEKYMPCQGEALEVKVEEELPNFEDDDYDDDDDDDDDDDNIQTNTPKESKRVRGLPPYTCPVCNWPFGKLKNYKDHLEELGHTPLEFPCDQCKTKFLGESPLLAHKLWMHRQDESKFCCDECHKEFGNQTGLKEHIKAMHVDNYHVHCPVCKVKVTQSHVNKHVRKVHNSTLKVKDLAKEIPLHKDDEPVVQEKKHRLDMATCPTCQVEVPEKDLEVHITHEHRSKRPRHSCPTCHENFQRQVTLRSHLEATGHEAKEFPCDQCDKSFFDEMLLKGHMLLKHRQDMSRFYCELCNKDFAHQRGLTLHVRLVHRNRKYMNCPMCDKKYLDLKFHIKRVHNQEKPYICELCGKGFACRTGLKKHLSREHGDSSMQVKCPECDMVCRHKQQLRYHMSTVHNPGTFVCEQCGKAYDTKAFLKTHTAMAHSENKGKTWPCDQCDYKGRVRSLLKYHIAHVHNKERNYQCDICMKKLGTGSSLRLHMKATHLHIKEFKCDECDYATTSTTKLKHHKEAMHEMKKVQCPYCPYQCGFSTNMHKHKKRKHANEMKLEKRK